MLDFIIYICIAIVLSCFLIGVGKHNEWAFGVAAAFLVIIAIGLFTSGWQTYSAQSLSLSYSGSQLQTVTPAPLQILPSATGTPEQQAVYGFAIFTLVSALACTLLSFREHTVNERVSRKLGLVGAKVKPLGR